MAALTTSEPPDFAARADAICMPCLSKSWPVAAEQTENKSSAMFAMVK